MVAHLFKRSIRQLQHIHDGDQAAVRLHHGQIQIVPSYEVSEHSTLKREDGLTVHLLQCIVTRHLGRRGVRMRRHDTDDTTPTGIQARSNDSENDVFTGEDTSNLRLGRRQARRMGHVLHDTNCRRATFLHELSHFAHSGLGTDSCGLCTRIHDRGEVRKRRLLTKCLDVGEHGRSLGVSRDVPAQLGLYARESRVQLLRCRGTSLDLVQGFMEDLRDVQQADDVPLLVTYGLVGSGCC